MGLGAGYLFSEFRALGADPARRRALFDRDVELVLQGWAGEPVSYQCAEFSAREIKVLPPVIQQPHPPLWIHGNSPFGISRAAAYAQGWIGMMTSGEAMVTATRTTALPGTSTIRERIGEVREAAESAGRDPDELEIVIAGPWPMLDVRQDVPAGTYLERVAELEAIGVDWVISLVCGDDVGATTETLDRFGAEVIGPTRSV